MDPSCVTQRYNHNKHRYRAAGDQMDVRTRMDTHKIPHARMHTHTHSQSVTHTPDKPDEYTQAHTDKKTHFLTDTHTHTHTDGHTGANTLKHTFFMHVPTNTHTHTLPLMCFPLTPDGPHHGPFYRLAVCSCLRNLIKTFILVIPV